MRLATLLGPDLKVTLQTAPEELIEALEEFHPEDIAEIVEEIDLDLSVSLFRTLPDEVAAEVMERISADLQEDILERLSDEEATDLVSEMSPDDLADLLQEVDHEMADHLIAQLEEREPEVAEEVKELRAYREDVAGGLMTTDYIALAPDTKVWQAIEEVRRVSHEEEAETVYYLYVVYATKLVGIVSLRDLILSDPGQMLADLMTEHVHSVRDTDDQEIVASVIAKYDFTALPVVDATGKMLGLVTVDDVVDVVVEEATEDAHLMGAVSPMEESYFEIPLTHFFRSRVTWLTLLFIGGLLTASVMEQYEAELETVITLAIFIPLIISSGGNAGSQSASLVIRALAVGDVKPTDWVKVLNREIITSVCLGVVLGIVGFGRVFLFGDIGDVVPFSIVVSSSIVMVVVVGSLVGSLLPLAIQRIGLDPAVSSTPFIASLVDVVGLLIYLNIAAFVLGIG